MNLDATALWLCRSGQTGAGLVLAGTAALRVLAWGEARSGIGLRWNRLARVSWGVVLLAALGQLALTAAQMSDVPLAQVLHGAALGGVLGGTHFGLVWRVRMGLLLALVLTELAGVAVERTGRKRLCAAVDLAAVLLVVSVLASLVAAGHAQASEKHVWLLPIDVIHAAAAGAWPGGLVPLFLLLAQARRHSEWLAAAVAITRRFSRLSVGAVGVLALSGSLNGYALVGTFSGLWTSVYGRLVVGKALLFLAMVVVGALNRRLIEQRPLENAQATVSRLWRNVALECAGALGVLLLTEALAMSAPPASAGVGM